MTKRAGSINLMEKPTFIMVITTGMIIIPTGTKSIANHIAINTDITTATTATIITDIGTVIIQDGRNGITNHITAGTSLNGAFTNDWMIGNFMIITATDAIRKATDSSSACRLMIPTCRW